MDHAMDHATIARWRLHSLLLRDSPARSAAAVVGRLAASQGQDLLPGGWALAQRAGGLTAAQVRAECDAGAVLRTHVLRPTWHFVAPADLRWLLTATAPRVHRANAGIYRRWGFDDAAFATIRRTLSAELAGGRHRTRAELGAALARAGLPLAGQGLAYALMYAELDALVCSGVSRGAQQTYALLDEQVPAPDDPTREEALAELARRYLTTRGPAAVHDLAAWASLTVGEAREAVAAVAGELASFDLDGVTYWHAPGEPPAADGEPRVDLVQSLDELVMSYSRTRDVLTGGLTWGEGAPIDFFHAVVVDGRLAGQWTYRRGTEVTVLTHPLRPWTPAERAGVEAAAVAFARFVDGEQARMADHRVSAPSPPPDGKPKGPASYFPSIEKT